MGVGMYFYFVYSDQPEGRRLYSWGYGDDVDISLRTEGGWYETEEEAVAAANAFRAGVIATDAPKSPKFRSVE